ncbi:MAG: hypothetical protein SFW67_24120 [Myxococcaceae bacterium]|nr:hypothetical protein [Myxococcaceae bacterium]
MKHLILAAAVVFSLPAAAASPGVCDTFLKAFEKAGKTVGEPPDQQTLDFFKGVCLKDKETDATITRQTKCLAQVKASADLKACFK